MKKAMFYLLMVVAVGFFTIETSAQEKELKTVCFKSSMDCENCQLTLNEYLKFEKGVKDLKVDLSSNTILIKYKDSKNDDENFAKAIEKKGYKAEKISIEDYNKIIAESEVNQHNHEQ